jgi:hypothetical protein
MNEMPTIRQTIAFVAFLAVLFILALVIVSRLPAPVTAELQPTPLPLEATPTALPEASAACRERAEPFVAQIDPLVAEWEGARRVAGRAAFADLPAQVAALEGLRSRAEALAPPACAAAAHASLLQTMDLVIEAYRGFAIERPEEPLRGLLAAADTSYATFQQQLDALR